MAKIIGLPKLSPTMEEGTLVRWVKQEGEAVQVDDLVAEVETDKATMEFRSFDQGVLLKQLAAEGATLLPDQPVCIIGKQGEDISALLKQAGAAVEAAGASKPAPEEKPAPSAKNAIKTPAQNARGAEPAEEPVEEPEGASDEHADDEHAESVRGRVFASPVVRKIAHE